ncbi:MAG TPA: SGNH/GDSL hydrolase family protein [Ideonella sp.]|uniref:SGNH/GDSL hydrolase family protein n=1 Tax=Ideonella sp. TaxID=1929293 RepID=UPI002C49C4E0|nr:SGNH/GDSL hydrolase family protein [Ideonella sp.]HSI49919.1 SGNH/GDSL hydrolase family protein [Ideonella sp.]
MSLFLKLALSPLLVAQALATRRRALVMPEAEGPREGRLVADASEASGQAPERVWRHAADGEPSDWGGLEPEVGLRLLIVGDSSAAGVGVARQQQALSGHLTRSLRRLTGIDIDWALVARSGLTTHGLLLMLQEQPLLTAREGDVAVVVTGVNDVITQVPSQRAAEQREALADWLLATRRARHVVFAPLPPIHQFPLLPQPLRQVMGTDARRHNAALAAWAQARFHERGDVSWVPIEAALSAETMAPDGFHPGEPVYRQCGEALAEHIAAHVWPRLQTPHSQETPP